MGIDIKAGGRLKSKLKTQSRSTNLYHGLLVRLYKFLTRRTESEFNRIVLRRLMASRVNRQPVSISRVLRNLKGKEDKIAVVVATVTNDSRLLDVPKLRIAALKFTDAARQRILHAGGECLTFDQLVLKAPTGSNTVFLRGPLNREQRRHFGPAPGSKHSHTKPYVRAKGRKFEQGKGRR